MKQTHATRKTSAPPPAATSVPPTSELFTLKELAERHPRLLPYSRLRWATRHRDENGLGAAGGVFESPSGELLLHEPAVIRWMLGLAGRSKPRAPRKAA